MGRRESGIGVLYPLSLVTYGLVMELVYVLDSKSRFCGFESHPGHQNPFYDGIVQLVRTPACRWISLSQIPKFGVRFYVFAIRIFYLYM